MSDWFTTVVTIVNWQEMPGLLKLVVVVGGPELSNECLVY